MQKSLRNILIFLLGVVITVILILIPWDTILANIGFDPFRTNVPASMKVNCFVGKCTVYLDGQKKGETPLELLSVASGQHTIKLERVSAEPDFYTDVSKKVNFLKGTEVYMEWEIGPSKTFSQGHVISYKERKHDTEPLISITSTQSDVEVKIDGVSAGVVPFLGDSDTISEGKHKITLSKKGYLDRDLEITINKNYIAQLEADLMALPLEVD